MKKFFHIAMIGWCSYLSAAASAPKPEADLPYMQHYNAGVTAQQSRNYENAIQHYKQALDQKSDFAEAWNNLGYCYRMIAKSYLAKAGDAYNKAVRYEPKYPEALEYQGEYFVMTGQLNYAYHNYQVLQQMQSKEAAELKEQLDDVLKQAQSILKQYTP